MTAIVTETANVEFVFDAVAGRYSLPARDLKYYTPELFVMFRGKYREALEGKPAGFVAKAFIAHMLHVKQFDIVLTANNTAFTCRRRGIGVGKDAAGNAKKPVPLPAIVRAYLNPRPKAD